MCRPDDFPPYDTAYPATVLDDDDPPEYEDEMNLAHRIKEEAIAEERWCNGHPDNSWNLSRVCEHGRLLPHVIEARSQTARANKELAIQWEKDNPIPTEKFDVEVFLGIKKARRGR